MSVLQIMAGQSFGKRLLKEFQRGGKKSIVLALLLLVGSYFWAPMLWRKAFPKSETPPPAATATVASSKTDSAGRQAGASPTSLSTAIDWKSLYRRVEKSSLIQPVALDELVRDPFDREWVRQMKPVVIMQEKEIPTESDPLRTMVLSAILAGADGGAAVINDVAYRVGQKVPEKGPIRYVLKEIRQDRVFLERAGKLEELSLNDTAIAPSESLDQDK